MNRPSSSNIGLAAALALATMLPALSPATASAASLPRLEADSMGGHHVVLPADAAGKPLVLLLAFTKESQGDLKTWSRKLLDDRIVQNASIYVVVVADKSGLFGRRRISKMVQSAAVGTKEQLNNNVLITFNGDGWRQLTPPGDKRDAGIVVCDASGSIVYAKREAFTDTNLMDVEKAAK